MSDSAPGPEQPLGTILAVSDGVWKYAGFEAVGDAAASDRIEHIPDLLLTSIRGRGYPELPDDFTVLALRADL